MKNLTSPQAIRIVAGGAIILFGLLTLLGSLELFNIGDVFGTWWPLLVIIAGALMLASSSRQYAWALIVILLGVLWQLETLEYIDFNIWQLFWPLILIGIGWSVIRDRPNLSRSESHEDVSDISVFLGGIETKNDSKNYKGGKVSTALGGGSLDLRKAILKKEATLEVFTLMGGFELKVPEGWAIDVQVTPILGGVENKTAPRSSSSAPLLRIVGTVVMGGIEIKN